MAHGRWIMCREVEIEETGSTLVLYRTIDGRWLKFEMGVDLGMNTIVAKAHGTYISIQNGDGPTYYAVSEFADSKKEPYHIYKHVNSDDPF